MSDDTQTAAVQMPENVRRAFELRPDAHLVLLEMGHAYGKAKFGGRCSFSGLVILKGSTHIRKLNIWARNGRHFEGYAHTDGCVSMFYGFASGELPEGVVSISTWRRWTPEWLTELGDLSALPVGATITIREAHDFATADKSWTKGRDGKWAGGERGWNHSSDKQLSATFKRRTKGFLWKLTLPEQSADARPLWQRMTEAEQAPK